MLGRGIVSAASKSTHPVVMNYPLTEHSLAFVEMRLLMSLLLWNFDLELDAVSNDWNKQSAFLLWEKPEMFVKIIPRQKQDV